MLFLLAGLVYFLALKMMALPYSETSMNSNWTTQCNIPEDRTLEADKRKLSEGSVIFFIAIEIVTVAVLG
jgi:hypothetical protein